MKTFTQTQKKLLLLAACGSIGAIASSAAAQPFQVNAHGATLLQNFITAPASTNDFIDVDINGVARRFRSNQQLAPGFTFNAMAPFFPANVWWVLDYNAIGSVNGVQELATWGRTFDTNNFHNTPGFIRSLDRQQSFYNRLRYINNGVQSDAIFNLMNPGAIPSRSSMDGLFTAQYAGDDIASPGGITNDIAPVDVPTNWAATRAGAANFSRLPGQPGYGNNQIQSINKDGSLALSECGTPFGHTLAELGTARVFGEGPTNADTIFDTPIAYATIAPITSFGTGRTQTTFSELRHLFVTGRTATGENLMAVTRDSGSGTRNAFYNSLCIDPSWGVGENIRTLSSLAPWDKLGQEFTPSNKAGTGGVEATVFNHRLAIGYVGAERAVRNAWLTGGRCEILGVRMDLDLNNDSIPDGTDFVRPTIGALLDNGLRGQIDPSTGVAYTVDGWQIGGPAVFATFGDPLSNTSNKGGIGWGEPFTDSNGNGAYDLGEPFVDIGTVDTTDDSINNPAGAGNGVRDTIAEPFIDLNSNGVYDLGEPFTDIDRNGVWSAQETRGALFPSMRNNEAAAFLNNMTRSIAFFSGLPGGGATTFTPGEFLAQNFILTAMQDRSQSFDNPCNIIVNPLLNQNLQNFARNDGAQVYANIAYTAFAQATNIGGSAVGSRAGRVPTRQTNEQVILVCGGTVPSNPETGPAIRYSDNDVAASINYTTQGGGTLNAGTNLPLRNLIAGDFNADGERNWNDIAQLVAAWDSRNGGPSWVSPAASGNLVAVSAASGMAVNPGDASIEILGDFNGDGNFGRRWNGTAFQADRSDVRFFADGLALDPAIGRLNRAQGFARVDNAWMTISGSNNFFGTTLATGVAYTAGDSAADISGNNTGKTPGFAPTGMDGTVNGFDIDYVYRQFRQNPRVTDGALNWADLSESAGTDQFRSDLSGDITGDLIIDQADVDAIVLNILNTSYGDVNLDGVCSAMDLMIAQSNLGQQGGWAMGDMNGDGTINAADITIIRGCIPSTCPCDVNNSGSLTSQDFFDFVTGFFNGTLDYNMDGAVTSQDFFDFLGCFFSPPMGC